MLLEAAENANTYTPLGPTEGRVANDRFVLWMGRGDGAGWNVAQRFRLREDEIEPVREEIHSILRARGRTVCTWEIGSSATPADLVERLLDLGLVDDEPTPVAVGMVLTESPADPPADVEVRRATTTEEHVAAARIAAVAIRDARADRGAAGERPEQRRLPRIRRRRARRTRLGVFRRPRGEPLRRFDAAGGPRPRRLPRARRRALVGRRRARHARARDAGEPDVAPDPRAARVPGGV